jgi:hypothetical protein
MPYSCSVETGRTSAPGTRPTKAELPQPLAKLTLVRPRLTPQFNPELTLSSSYLKAPPQRLAPDVISLPATLVMSTTSPGSAPNSVAIATRLDPARRVVSGVAKRGWSSTRDGDRRDPYGSSVANTWVKAPLKSALQKVRQPAAHRMLSPVPAP